jgi:hypothetical protein
METAFCAYCLQPFERVGRKHSWDRDPKATCGQAICKARTTAWNGWIRDTAFASACGDVRSAIPRPRPLPPKMGDAAAAQLFDLLEPQQQAA